MTARTITSDDVIFFMDMVNSPRSPNHIPGFHQPKPYYKILDDPESEEFRRFIKVYNAEKHVLKEREQKILADLYGVTHPKVNLKEASAIYNVTPERIRQIRQKAERKITTSLLKRFKQELHDDMPAVFRL
ncbi:hypothetical protein GCM10028778_21090 [Barrientosiimonas marina]|uniref:Sigma factor-like helix-turn-helix DNA-binding protein n=1 Tax=Lentibacillus kimchii TaxID=1542911 RepID=A0ABW2UXI0_9BACI